MSGVAALLVGISDQVVCRGAAVRVVRCAFTRRCRGLYRAKILQRGPVAAEALTSGRIVFASLSSYPPAVLEARRRGL